MNDRRRSEELGGGGMTGATGDLVPDTTDEAFVPGERREQSGDQAQAAVTHHQGAGAPAQRGETGDPSGDEAGGPTNMAERESGYGSEHGLAPDDPAYRMEVHPPILHDPGSPAGDEDGEPRIGGDELSEREERF